jgi:outer membrane lipoprotein SlyB
MTAVSARQKTQWVHDGQAYGSYEACRRAKNKSRDRAAVVGAASSGVVAAIAGGSVAETALVAGAGALTGAVIGKNAKKC